MDNNYKWDIFLSHASEDKEAFVTPLYLKLIDHNIKAWYDDFEIKLGDSIRESIDEGLKNSKFAIVVLSKNYFTKSWTSNELNAYFALDSKDAKRILPIWYDVTREEVTKYSPILADRLGTDPKDGMDGIIQKVKKRLNMDFTPTPIPSPHSILKEEINWTNLSVFTRYRFKFLDIDEFWQASLLEDIYGNGNYKTIEDIDNIVRKAMIAVAAYAREYPEGFESGTDFITKSLGFVDKDFRRLHRFSGRTLAAFQKYQSLVTMDY